MAYTAEQVTKIESALRRKGLDEAEVQKIVGLIRPKPVKAPKVEEVLTPAEAAIRAEMVADDLRAEDYKSRLWSSYHRKGNGAGRRNPMSLSAEIEEINKDPNVQGLARFC